MALPPPHICQPPGHGRSLAESGTGADGAQDDSDDGQIRPFVAGHLHNAVELISGSKPEKQPPEQPPARKKPPGRGSHRLLRGCCICLIQNGLIGGEGEIRTPDSLATMSDFESGAFNRALPPLRVYMAPVRL